MSKVTVKKFKNGSELTLSGLVLFLLLWVLVSFNSGSADHEYYVELFNRAELGITYHAVEDGFWLLVQFCVWLGLSFDGFIKIYSLVALLLYTSTIVRYTRKSYLIFICYIFYPFLLDVAQIRHFMACAIFVYSIRYLEKFTKRNVVMYCIFVFVAASQQIMAFAFYVFLLTYISDKKNIIRYSIILTILGFTTCKLIVKSRLFKKVISSRNTSTIYENGISTSQFFMYLLFYLILIGLCVFLTYYDADYRSQNEEISSYDCSLFKICMISSIYIPFLLIDFQYTRLFRACLIPIYIYINNGFDKLKRKDQILKLSFYIMMAFVCYKLFGPSSGYYSSITYPIIFENDFFW